MTFEKDGPCKQKMYPYLNVVSIFLFQKKNFRTTMSNKFIAFATTEIDRNITIVVL